ncbi:hypothetical protein NQZ68_039527 [Dissostichus eleginoides]|nr:hypothetical protein NQZ68_039527 [Dissostichus eleginoides]
MSVVLLSLVKQRLTAAAEEIFVLFERTIAEYEEELSRSKQENERHRKLLDAVLQPQLQIHRAEISGLERTVSEPPLPSACSSPVRMEGSPLTTSSSSQESLVDLIQPVGRHKQVKRKRDSSSGLLVYLEKKDERLLEQGQAMLKEQGQAMLKEQGQAMLKEQGQAMLKEQGQAMLQEQGQAMLQEQGQAMLHEVHVANTEFLQVFSRIEQNSHSMLGLVDRIVKVMETNNKS